MYTSKIAIVTVVLALIGLTSAQVINDGPCPNNINVIPDFDVEKYMGLWYEYAKYPAIFEANGKCVTAKYALQSNGEVSVLNSMINKKTNESEDIEGEAQYVENAKLLVTFPVSPDYKVSTNYWVLDTDYDNYSVVYSCQPVNNDKHLTFVWILTRDREPTSQLVFKADKVLLSNHIALRHLVKTDQNDCN